MPEFVAVPVDQPAGTVTTVPAPAPAPAPVAPQPADPKVAAPADGKPASGAPKPGEETPEQKAAREAQLSPRFAALAKREREIVQKQQKLQAELAEERRKIEDERKEIAGARGKVAQYEAARSQAKLNPSGLLTEIFGENWYEALTEFKLKGASTASPEEIAATIRNELKGEFEAKEKEREAREAKERESRDLEARKAAQEREAQIIAQFRQDLTAYGKEHAEEFELVNLYGQHDLVFEVIQSHHAKTGKVLNNQEAYGLVEKHLEGELAKSRTAKKFQGAGAPPAAGAKLNPPATPPPASPTLSNGSSAAPSFVGGPVSEAERMARALAAMDAAGARAS